MDVIDLVLAGASVLFGDSPEYRTTGRGDACAAGHDSCSGIAGGTHTGAGMSHSRSGYGAGNMLCSGEGTLTGNADAAGDGPGCGHGDGTDCAFSDELMVIRWS